MGYTHYFEYKPESITAMQAMVLCQDVRQIVECSEIAITGWSSRGTEAPEFNPEGRIAFNGIGDEGCETFAIQFNAPQEPNSDDELERYHYKSFIERDRAIWSFCKTNYRPYDRVVCAALLRAVDVLPEFIVDSDGSWNAEKDWIAGRDLYFHVFGQEPVCPWEYD